MTGMTAGTTRSKSARSPDRLRSAPERATPEKWGWHYRTLLALRDHLSGSAGDRLREPFDAMEPPSVHPEDLVDELHDRDLASALPRNPAEAIRELNDALDRLITGTYGICEATGQRIPNSQLRAKPWRRFREGVTTA